MTYYNVISSKIELQLHFTTCIRWMVYLFRDTLTILSFIKVIRDLDSAKEKMVTLSDTYRLCCVPGCSVHYRQAATGSE